MTRPKKARPEKSTRKKATASPPAPRKNSLARSPTPLSAEKQLESFLGKFTPDIAAQARTALRKMRARLPGDFDWTRIGSG